MSVNFFKFTESLHKIEYPFDPSRPFEFFSFGGTPWFYISGYAYESESKPTEICIEKCVFLAKGVYKIKLDKNLKGFNQDKVFLSSSDNSFVFELTEESKELVLDRQTQFDLVFSFSSGIHYLKGDYFSAQEDYGKDYSIIINLISGGIFDSPKEKAVLKGDINGDGIIDIEDLSLLKQYVLGAELYDISTDLFRMDINEDGTIDENDVYFLEDYIFAKKSLNTDVEYREENV